MDEKTMIKLIHMALEAYEVKHPRPKTVNHTQAAEMLGVAQQTVSFWVKHKKIGLNGMGHIPMSEVERLLKVSSVVQES